MAAGQERLQLREKRLDKEIEDKEAKIEQVTAKWEQEQDATKAQRLEQQYKDLVEDKRRLYDQRQELQRQLAGKGAEPAAPGRVVVHVKIGKKEQQLNRSIDDTGELDLLQLEQQLGLEIQHIAIENTASTDPNFVAVETYTPGVQSGQHVYLRGRAAGRPHPVRAFTDGALRVVHITQHCILTFTAAQRIFSRGSWPQQLRNKMAFMVTSYDMCQQLVPQPRSNEQQQPPQQWLLAATTTAAASGLVIAATQAGFPEGGPEL